MHWSERKNTIEEYISPKYYDSIIKDYIFNGISDLKIFQEYLSDKKFNNILELGCGSGRATDAALGALNYHQITLVDLSSVMIDFVSRKYSNLNEIRCKKSDHINYLRKSENKFDLVYCMWSLSHSIHAHLYEKGKEKGSEEVFNIVESFIRNNILKGGEMFIIHFDSTSQEQIILLNQWKKVYSLYTDITEQTPSKKLLDKVFEYLCRENVIEFSCEHYIGEEIEYQNDDEYLELFMNFHLETFFNKTDMFEDVKNSILSLGEKYKDQGGKYYIKPGCFIYKIKRL